MLLNLIGYIIVIVILIYIYIVLLTLTAKTLFFLFKESKQWILQKLKRIKEDRVRVTFAQEEYLKLIQNPFFLQSKKSRLYLVLFFVGNVFAWQYFRYTDVTNTEFEHKEAREYYALGHLLLTYDMGLVTLFRNPDSIFLRPINSLQDTIIENAKENLPDNDGEIALYHYMFKLFPFMETHYDPAPSEAKKIEALTYKVLKEFSILPIQDKEVREYSRYRLYPMAAEYFLFIQWEEYKTPGKSMRKRHYSEKVYTSLYKDPFKIKQLEDIGRWSLMHYEELKKYPKINRFIQKNPLIDAMYLADIILPLRGVLESKIFNLTFRCEDDLLAITHKYTGIYNKKYFKAKDKRYWGYKNAIVSQAAPFSNTSCALCSYEPIMGTYLPSFKRDTCYPPSELKSLIKEYREEDAQTHYKWAYRVAALEKTILKTNIREQLLQCYQREWTSPTYGNYMPKDEKSKEIKKLFTQCLLDKGLIQPDREKYTECYTKEWMEAMASGRHKDMPQLKVAYKKCLTDNNLIKLSDGKK